jgi:hypothetical protein
MSTETDPLVRQIMEKLRGSPKDVTLWLMLASRLSDANKKKDCYHRVLALDPSNEEALKGLEQSSAVPAKKISFINCPMCSFPNAVTESQCKRCGTTLPQDHPAVQVSATAPPSTNIEPITSPVQIIPQPDEEKNKSKALEKINDINSKISFIYKYLFVYLCILIFGGILPFTINANNPLFLPVLIIIGLGTIGALYALLRKKYLQSIVDTLSNKYSLQVNAGTAGHTPTLTSCKACQKEIAVSAPSCPHCGISLPGLRVSCPSCGSMNIQVIEKGFSAIKAVTGAALLGPLGLIGGFHGAKNLEYYCLDCHRRFST